MSRALPPDDIDRLICEAVLADKDLLGLYGLKARIAGSLELKAIIRNGEVDVLASDEMVLIDEAIELRIAEITNSFQNR